MLIRRFSSDLKTKIPGGHSGVYAVPIQYDRSWFAHTDQEQLVQRFNGLPLLVNSPTAIVAMYLGPCASIDEHSSPTHSGIFMVLRGSGFVRIGGAEGETREIAAGDAVLWPAKIDHTVWTEEESLDAIVVEVPTEPGE